MVMSLMGDAVAVTPMGRAARYVGNGVGDPEGELAPLPTGLRRLIRIGKVLAEREWPGQLALRVIVTVPTTRLAGIAVALGSSMAKPVCDVTCLHTQFDATPRLAACYLDRYLQDRLAWADAVGVHVGNSTFTNNIESVHRLPDGFPNERNRVPRNVNSHSEEEIQDLAAAYHEAPLMAGLRRSKIGAHPVLCIGNMAEVRNDLSLARSVPQLAALHPVGRLAPGEHYESWFRHPMLVVARPPLPGQHPWLGDVRPRLVVRVGEAAALFPMHGLWPTVPHVILLSRRSPSSLDAVEAIREMSWQAVNPDLHDLGTVLRPGDGLEVGCFTEPGSWAPRPDEDLEEDEW